MRQLLFSVFLILSLIISTDTNGCTSAIITGKITADGRPLLWKHRDTGEENNRIQYFKGEKYNFIALVNSPDEGGIIWMGTNDAGFSIMNTASYNLKDDKIKEMDKEGEIMFEALSVCKNISEFEEFLKNHKKPLRVEANFGVIDAEGGAAYFETNNTKYVKVDANDQRIAPEGYLIYTNYSYSGRFNEGMGYIRYQTASEIFSPQAVFMNITPQWIFDNLSRSYYHSLMGIDYKNPEFSPEKGRGWVIDQDFIPRKSSTASIVIQGVKPGENPEMTTMWTILGYPPAGVAIPLWVKTAENQPSVFLKAADSQNAKACDLALSLKHKTFSLKRGNGSRYMYFPLIYNSNGTGYLQVLKNSEESIYSLFKEPIERWRKDGLNVDEIKQLNDKASQILVEGYNELL